MKQNFKQFLDDVWIIQYEGHFINCKQNNNIFNVSEDFSLSVIKEYFSHIE